MIGRGHLERLESIPGSVPDPFTVLPGCPFHPRCEHRVKDVCELGDPPALQEVSAGHWVACHLYDETGRGQVAPPSPYPSPPSGGEG